MRLTPNRALSTSALSLVAILSLEAWASAQSLLPPPASATHWVKTGNDIHYKYTGNVGIGTNSPQYKLEVNGSGICVISATNSIVSNGAAAICGEASSTSAVTIGVYGNCHSDQGRGVFGAARNLSGSALGVYGISYADAGSGVYGYAISPTGQTYGVYGRADSPQGFAGYFQGRALFTGPAGFGGSTPTYPVDAVGAGLYVIRGENSIASNGAAAIYGHATSTSSVTIGVFGECESDTGRGVFGRASNGVGNAIGVYGYSAAGAGSYGVFAGGNSGATGVKSFRIDHPLDPFGSYLLHYSSESPEPQNFYNGTARLDESGQAWVQLPDYFQEINRDFRYQLTALDAAMPELHVAHRIEGNSFQIGGGKPLMEVSWEVKAIRNDAWVRAHPAPAEVHKPASERGKLQRPELYGLAPELGIDYRTE